MDIAQSGLQDGALAVEIGIYSDRGGQAVNEDFAGATGVHRPLSGRGMAAAVADGMGGGGGGHVAAELAVRTFLDACASDDPMRGVRQNGASALEAINRWLHAIGLTDPQLENLASTLTALVLRGRQAHVLHVGDTRLYRLREGVLTLLTVDHSHRAEHRILTRALGLEPEVRIDYVVEAAQPSDRYMICSDGVYTALPDSFILEELVRRASPEETARRLVMAAQEAVGGNNATALIVDVLRLPQASRIDFERSVASLPIVAAPRTGAIVDGYELQELLSDGVYSRVFRASDRVDGTDVIVKFPKPAPGLDPVLRQAFLREAWIASRVRSPFVAEGIEPAADRRTCLYTVMPYYLGETLEQRLRHEPMVSLAEGLDIAVKLGRGVAALHRAGVIHRDIKPDNVLLESEGGVRLLDLGVARLPNMEDFPASDIPGTPSYMAPELARGNSGEVASDIFALGVTTYRMFAGAFPYGEFEPFSRPRYARRAIPLRNRRPDLPTWLEAVIARSIALRPVERFPDALELVSALEHGAIYGAPLTPQRQPLLYRDPVRFWQLLATLLGLGLVGSLLFR